MFHFFKLEFQLEVEFENFLGIQPILSSFFNPKIIHAVLNVTEDTEFDYLSPVIDAALLNEINDRYTQKKKGLFGTLGVFFQF